MIIVYSIGYHLFPVSFVDERFLNPLSSSCPRLMIFNFDHYCIYFLLRVQHCNGGLVQEVPENTRTTVLQLFDITGNITSHGHHVQCTYGGGSGGCIVSTGGFGRARHIAVIVPIPITVVIAMVPPRTNQSI